MTEDSLYAIVLAAGEASRFGSTKQLAKFAGQPLVARAIRTAETVCGPRSLLIVGNDWPGVTAACHPLQGFMAVNPDFRNGMASSIKMAVRSVSEVAKAVLLLLADQPLVTASHLEVLANAWRASPDSICASAYAETVGPPVIFPARCFPELMELKGDRGARRVIDRNRDNMIAIRLEEAAVDIDRPDDLSRF
jgi:CTP:molybdopterin cytidylyltransferase MocA